MSTQEIKAIYLSMKESGDLNTLFPEMTGNWTKDEKAFTSQYNSNEEALEDSLGIIDLDDDLEIY